MKQIFAILQEVWQPGGIVCHKRFTATNILPIIFLVVGFTVTGVGEAVDAQVVILRCTNPVSGATWDTKINFENKTADSFPATITEESIKWHNVLQGGQYSLDRISGELTVLFASSTGGFALKDKCRFTQ